MMSMRGEEGKKSNESETDAFAKTKPKRKKRNELHDELLCEGGLRTSVRRSQFNALL